MLLILLFSLVCLSPAHYVLPPSIYLLMARGRVNECDKGCHVCSHKGQRGPGQRQEVSYPCISLCFCHQLDSPSLSFSVTLYLSRILFCPLCLSSMSVLSFRCHTSQLFTSKHLSLTFCVSTQSNSGELKHLCILTLIGRKWLKYSFDPPFR